VIWKTVAGKSISPAQAKMLLTKGETAAIHGFRSKAGKTFDARLRLERETGKVAFAFEPGRRNNSDGRC